MSWYFVYIIRLLSRFVQVKVRHLLVYSSITPVVIHACCFSLPMPACRSRFFESLCAHDCSGLSQFVCDRNEDCYKEGHPYPQKPWCNLPLPSFPLFSFSSPSPFRSLPFPSLPIKVGPLKSSSGIWGSAVSSPSRSRISHRLELLETHFTDD